MADNDRNITTTWTVVDKASSVLNSITSHIGKVGTAFSGVGSTFASGGSVIASALAKLNNNRNALGQFQVTPLNAAKRAITSFASSSVNALKGLGSSISQVTNLAPGLGFAFSTVGIGLAAVAVANLGDNFEKTQLQIAGFLVGLGRTADIDQGLRIAASTMEQIRVAAALLPGEASDYIRVFQDGLPVINGAIGGTMKNMTAFSNQFSAVTNVLSIDSGQAARDLNLMLQAGQGRAGANVKSFARMLPFIRQIGGQADLTAQSFNKMSQAARGELITKALTKFQPMLDRAANTFDAMKGAAMSSVKEIVRLGSQPLFEGMKSGLKSFNAALSNSDGSLTQLGNRVVNFGKMMSAGIVAGVNTGVDALKKLMGWFDRLSTSPAVSRLVKSFSAISSGIGDAVSSLGQSSGAMGMAAGGASMALGGVTAPVAGVVALFVELSNRGTFLADTFQQIVNYAGMLIAPLSQFAEFLGMTITLAADLVQGVLPGLIDAFTLATEPIVLFAGHMLNIASVTLQRLRPALLMFWDSIGTAVRAIGNFLNPVIRIVGTTLLFLYDKISSFLIPVIDTVTRVFSILLTALSSFISWIGGVIGKGADWLEDASGRSLKSAFSIGGTENVSDKSNFFSDFMKSLDAKQFAAPAEDLAGGALKSRGGGGRVNQDFRFSRFDIQQKFEGDLTPDQVAVAFAKDLAAIGERRMDSGFSPLFGVS